MPLVDLLPIGPDTAQWSVWSTTARLVVTDRSALARARAIVEAELDQVDLACSRFRPDSELAGVYRAAGQPVPVSQRLAELVAASLRAAEETDGDVDPTIAVALRNLGYDRDFADLPGSRSDAVTSSVPVRDSGATLVVLPAPGWRRVRLDGSTLTVPAGVELDLGATAKAWAADRCADLVAAQCGVGVLVSLGGDIATAGAAPDGGWRVLVQDRPGDPATTVSLPAGAGLATSSTVSRQWGSDGGVLHHILDPRNGLPTPPVWRTATVAAESCVAANTVSTAVIVRGRQAPAWLREIGAPARLVAADGQVRTFGTWPTDGTDVTEVTAS